MHKHIPNAITLLNAFLGALAALSLLSGQVEVVPWLLAAALLADFGDGLAARLLRASSPIGKELDSLADLISFGLVPALIFYRLMGKTIGKEQLNWADIYSTWPLTLSLLLLLASALRLAKFNIDTRQSENFIGLNTPACTIFCLGLLLIIEGDEYGLSAYILQWPILLGLILLLCFLLLSEIPIFSFKIKSLAWSGNQSRYIFVAIAFVLFVSLKIGLALALSIICYLFIALIHNFANASNRLQ